ncbi:MAG: hypothetical protein E7067_00495 [Lentimicrobiaceae bacterium]|nr:hypothetical protein [Lentimicrobiaceae bacterium]
MTRHKSFFIALSLMIVAVLGLTQLIRLSLPQFITHLWWAQMLFFVLVSVIVYLFTTKMRNRNDFHKFNNFYMLTTVAKLILYLAVLATYSLMFREDSKAFIITFLIYYLCFTVFETCILVRNKN